MEEKKLKPKRDDNDRYGYIDENGNWVIKAKFDYAHDFQDGIAMVELDEKFGFIKTDGSYLIEQMYDEARDFKNGIAKVELDEKLGILKTDGTYLIEPKFDQIGNFEEGFAFVDLDGKWGFIKTDGTYLVEPKFDQVRYFEEGFAEVKLDGKWGLLKTDGTYLIEPKFDQIGNFEEGFARVKLDGKYGFIKTDGTYLIEPKFDKARIFHNGEAFVMDNGLYKILLSDGTFKKMSKMEEYILSCIIIQNWEHGGWSFLEATNNDGKWKFISYARNIYDNRDWYEAIEFPEEVCGSVVRYYDEVDLNNEFAAWADSLNLSTPEEVGELLWANAQQLIDDAQIEQETGGYKDPLQNLTLLILLYNQLENIKNLGLIDLRKNLDLPKEKESYLNPDMVKKLAVKLCKEEQVGEYGYEELDFEELLERSRKPGEYKYISDYEFSGEDWEEEDWDEED